MENSWTITENPLWTSHRKIMKSSCLGRLKKRKIHGPIVGIVAWNVVLDVAKYQETGSIMQHYATYSTARICLDPGISHAELENWNMCRRSLIFGWCAGP